MGYNVEPDDARVALAVEAYFSAFVDYAVPLPGTLDMLTALQGRYRLGLLSNLTHAPAAVRIIDRLGMTPFFDVVLVSGQLGYRKPHPRVFHTLIEHLNVPKEQTAFVGDNLDADIKGAQQVGIQPIWMNYVQAQKAREAQSLAASATGYDTGRAHHYELAGALRAPAGAITWEKPLTGYNLSLGAGRLPAPGQVHEKGNIG